MKIQRSNSQIPTLIASVGPQDASSEERFRYASPKITNWRRVSSLTSVRTEGMSTISVGVEFSASERCLSRLSSVPPALSKNSKNEIQNSTNKLGRRDSLKKIRVPLPSSPANTGTRISRRVSYLKSQQEKIRKSLSLVGFLF